MGRPIKDLGFAALLLSALVTACAGVIGVDEPILDPAALSPGGEGGPGSVSDGGPIACSPATDNCPPSSFCGATNECTPGCKGPQDCRLPAPYCNLATHQCVTCRDDTDCMNGGKCSPGGKCAAICTGTGACGSGGTCCSSLCLDTRSDALNCGGCGTLCSKDHGLPNCTKGTCEWVCTTGWIHCGSGNTGCETPSNTLANCGSCGTNCAMAVKNASPICDKTQCGYSGACKNGFVDLDNNRANGCETPCGADGQICCNGNCNSGLSCQNNAPGRCQPS